MRQKKFPGTDYDAHRYLKETAAMCQQHRSYPRASAPVHQPIPVFKYVVIGLAIAIAVAAAMRSGSDSVANLEDRQYCEMVALHLQQPDLGWPDFDHRFADDCNADGSVREDE